MNSFVGKDIILFFLEEKEIAVPFPDFDQCVWFPTLFLRRRRTIPFYGCSVSQDEERSSWVGKQPFRQKINSFPQKQKN